MKRLSFLSLFALILFAGNAMAADLNGLWIADNYCVPGDDPLDPSVPKYEESEILIEQNGMFFVTNNISPTPGEECGGVINGKEVFLTCPPVNPDAVTGTIFYGELKGQNEIIGINHVPDDGATCSVVAIRQ